LITQILGPLFVITPNTIEGVAINAGQFLLLVIAVIQIEVEASVA
jgi:hypothetical protein